MGWQVIRDKASPRAYLLVATPVWVVARELDSLLVWGEPELGQALSSSLALAALAWEIVLASISVPK